jgi:tetratricopeptide (TPR) repeat protein
LVLAVFVLALLVRSVYLVEGSDSPAFFSPLVDSLTYDRLARGLAGGTGLTDEFFWQPLFYPLFLAAVYLVSGSSLLWAKVVQILLGAATCALTYLLGERVGGPKNGLLAGVITALYGPLVFFDGELLATVWACFWSVALLLLILHTARDGNLALDLVVGVCGALATLTRPTFLPFLIVAGLWLAVVLRGKGVSGRRVLGRLGATVSGFVLVGVPVALLCGQVTGRVSMLPASGGINLYAGNNPDVPRTLTLRPGWEWDQFTRMPRFHGVTRKQDTSRFFTRRFAEYVRSDPVGFLAGLGAKAVQFVSSRELPRNVDIYLYRDWSATLRLLVWKVGPFGFPFGVLLPLAAIGLLRPWSREQTLLVLCLLTYSAAVILVFVSARYRTPVVPALSVLAGGGILALVEMLREARWRRLAAVAVSMVALILLGTLPGPFPQERTDYRAEMDYLLGHKAVDRGDDETAVRLLGLALRRDPGHADAHNSLGTVLYRQGQPHLAIEHFEQALQTDASHAVAHANLARVLVAQGRRDEALGHFALALESNPFDADLHKDYAMVLSWTGRAHQALEHLSRALELGPRDADLHVRIGRLLFKQDRLVQAEEQFEAALAIDALNEKALAGLASTLLRQGRRDEAAARHRDALALARRAGRSDLAARLERKLAELE